MTKTFSGSFAVGDVLAYDTYSNTSAAKVLDYIYVTPLVSEGKFVSDAVKYWVLQHGRVVDDTFVPSGTDSVSFLKTETVCAYGYTYLWVKPPSFKDGEFLISDKGDVFYHENKDQVWRVSGDDIARYGAMHASLKSRTKDHGKLKVLNTAGGRAFKEHVSK